MKLIIVHLYEYISISLIIIIINKIIILIQKCIYLRKIIQKNN